MAHQKIHNVIYVCLLVTSLMAVTSAAALYGVNSHTSVDAKQERHAPASAPAAGGVTKGSTQYYQGLVSNKSDGHDDEASDDADDDDKSTDPEDLSQVDGDAATLAAYPNDTRDAAARQEHDAGDVEEAAEPDPSLDDVEEKKTRRGDDPEEEEEEEEEEEDDEDAYEECPVQQFYSAEDQTCRACSTCAGLQVVSGPCGGRRDTQCGPIPMDVFAFLREPVEGGQPSGQDDSHNHNHDVESAILNEAGNQWRTLSFALITVLAVICCIVVAVGVYVCVACRQARHQEIFAQPGLLPVARQPEQAEPRYVQTFFTSSRDRVRPARPLPAYQPIYTGSHFLSPLTSAMKPDVTSHAFSSTSSASDHEYIYINCPEDLDEEVDEVVRISP